MENINHKTENNNPLVSIIVITYNSSKYVIETLESAKAQTYQNIELIVSDDCSSDNTVEICRNWIEDNNARFVRTALVTVEKNTGIAPNCNRGVAKSKGEWIKLIAGDDLFFKDAILLAVIFIKTNSNLSIFASKAQNIIEYDRQFVDYESNKSNNNNNIFFLKINDANYQHYLLLKNNYIIAPTVFLKKSLWETVKFNEQIPNIEDYPYWIEITKLGYYIGFLDNYTVYYRLHEESESGFEINTLFNKFYKKDFDFKKNHLFRYYNFTLKFNTYYLYFVRLIFDKFKFNNKKFKYLYLCLIKINFINN